MTQLNRLLSIEAPLGDDVVTVRSLSGSETLSGLFEFEIVLDSAEPAIEASDLVGQPVAVRVDRGDRDPRLIHGVVEQLTHLGRGQTRGVYHYEIRVVPWLWLLGQTTDCRVFQYCNLVELLEGIFGEYPFAAWEHRLHHDHPRWDCRVQYRESDLAFLSRLLEHAGIFYYFRHEAEGHRLVVADDPRHWFPLADRRKVWQAESMSGADIECLTAWHDTRRLVGGSLMLDDYDPILPGVQLRAGHCAEPARCHGPADRLERYEYAASDPLRIEAEGPAARAGRQRMERLARIRMEELEAHEAVVSAASTYRDLQPGARFEFTPQDDPGGTPQAFVVTSVRHRAVEPGLADERGAPPYTNTFTAIPADRAYRPPRRTRRPNPGGHQSAVVVGPPGERVWPDELGRVKVQFHWDRRGGRDEHSSCWLRVSEAWAGQGYGTMHIPHVGQEVLVGFLDGDIDRPFVSGRLYNAAHPVPRALPENKYQTVVARDHFGNEIILDGTPDNEHIRIMSPSSSSAVIVGGGVHLRSSRTLGMAFGPQLVGADPEPDACSDGGSTGLPTVSNPCGGTGLPTAELTTRELYEAFKDKRDDTVLRQNWFEMFGTHGDFDDGDKVAVSDKDAFSYTKGSSESIAIGNVAKWTEGNSFSHHVGNTVSEFIGTKQSYTAGLSFSAQVSASHSLNLSFDHSVFAGAKHSLSYALTTSIAHGPNFKLTLGLDANIAFGGKMDWQYGRQWSFHKFTEKHSVASREKAVTAEQEADFVKASSKLEWKDCGVYQQKSRLVQVSGSKILLDSQ